VTDSSDRDWAFAMIREANDAAALFSHGVATVRGMRFDYTGAVVAMSLLAFGAEKMLKLTIGLAHLDLGRPWPDYNYMQHTIGHRVETADLAARALLNANSGTAPGDIKERMAAVDADPVLAAALSGLQRFGTNGRFYYLDQLASRNQPLPAPQTLWSEMTTQVAALQPCLLGGLASPDTYEKVRLELNELIAGSLELWWQLYVAAWGTGVIGERQSSTHLNSGCLRDEDWVYAGGQG
jgi:hypothetical protein